MLGHRRHLSLSLSLFLSIAISESSTEAEGFSVHDMVQATQKPLIPSWSTCFTLTSNNQERATTKKTARHIKTNQKTKSSKQVKNHQTTYIKKQQKH